MVHFSFLIGFSSFLDTATMADHKFNSSQQCCNVEKETNLTSGWVTSMCFTHAPILHTGRDSARTQSPLQETFGSSGEFGGEQLRRRP